MKTVVTTERASFARRERRSSSAASSFSTRRSANWDRTALPSSTYCQSQGIIPGIKVDKSTKPLEGSTGELITEGLDGLRDRLSEYAGLGAKFTKWRAVITIGDGIPSRRCIAANAHSLTRFAALSQEAGLVPIVEPEVLMDGEHSIETCYEVTTETLREVYYSLGASGVALEGTLLKPNMVLSGKDAPNRAGPDQVAEMTVRALMNTVPASVPGMVFLSGGQSDSEATDNLDAINRYARSCSAPWELSFSYGRGLQAAPLKAWAGESQRTSRPPRPPSTIERKLLPPPAGASTPRRWKDCPRQASSRSQQRKERRAIRRSHLTGLLSCKTAVAGRLTDDLHCVCSTRECETRTGKMCPFTANARTIG